MAYKILNKNKIDKETKDNRIANDKGVNSTSLLDISLLVNDLQQFVMENLSRIMELNQLVRRQLTGEFRTLQSDETVQSVLSSDGLWRSQRLWPPEKESFALKVLRRLFRLRP